MFFVLLPKSFSFSRKSNFRILDIQIFWCHQMPKHKTRNTFYWITWNQTQYVNEIWPVYVILQKKKIIETFYKNCDLKTSFRHFGVCKELSTTTIEK